MGGRAFTLADILRPAAPSIPLNEQPPALVFAGLGTSRLALDARANKLACALKAEGIRHGDRVAMLSYNRPEWFVLLFALAKIGAVLVPINYLLKPREIGYILEESGPAAIVCEDELWEKLGELSLCRERHFRSYVIGNSVADRPTLEELMDSGSEDGIECAAGPNDIILLQYTSGTTGLPKAVTHTHSSVLWNSIHQISEFGITDRDVHLLVPALCWAAGFHAFTLSTLWAGGTVVVRHSQRFSGESFCHQVQEQQVTRSVLVPSALRMVLRGDCLERFDVSSLRVVDVGGEPAPVKLLEEANRRLPNCRFIYSYGQTEFPAFMTYIDSRSSQLTEGCVGAPSLIATMRIVDEAGEPVPPWTHGQLTCCSPATMSGYYGQPAATDAVLRDGWLHTGDRGYVDDKGNFYVVGRDKDMLISGGLNIYPAEIERVLVEHTGVVEAAVIGIRNERYGEAPRAYVVVNGNERVTEADLTAFVRTRLANYKVPVEWVIQEEPLPKTASGKVHKASLRAV